MPIAPNSPSDALTVYRHVRDELRASLDLFRLLTDPSIAQFVDGARIALPAAREIAEANLKLYLLAARSVGANITVDEAKLAEFKAHSSAMAVDIEALRKK
ncbi:hypothetical protein JYJ95_37850 [Corallococcus exiguus]|uniref:hypothetical protein n=1 Tax=Corallococcus exiguus TaxID=83462 RepID=UPI001A8DE463|nr:hypothetical protein [Corallococcus exiguus]MBN8472301.1 hypothetical protein [Corallococcus exiguus]